MSFYVAKVALQSIPCVQTSGYRFQLNKQVNEPSKPTHIVSCPISKTETFRTEMDDWTLLDSSIRNSII